MDNRLYFKVFCAAILMLVIGFSGCSQKIEYPVTKTVEVVESYHGTEVADPYQWLEDDNSEETKAWVLEQNEITFPYLRKIAARKKIEERLTQLWNYEKYTAPFKRAGNYFFRKNDGLQNQYVLYIQQTLESDPKVLLDPNILSDDGTIALATYSVSENGRYLMYGLSSGGSDWMEFHIKNIRSGDDYEDHLKWIKFSNASWTKDSKGFYYARYPEPVEGKAMVQQNRNQKLYYHRINTHQKLDKLIYEDPNHPDRGFGTTVTEDGEYLVITVWEGTDKRNRVYYMKITSLKKGPIIKLLDRFDASYEFIGNNFSTFYFKTDLNAPRERVIAIDVDQPERSNWREIISEQKDVLYDINLINNQFVTVYMQDAHHVIKVFDLNGKFINEIPLPALGSVDGIRGRQHDTEMFYGFSSFAYPYTIYKYDLMTKENTIFFAPDVDFNPAEFETKQVFYPSKDGTQVPMFITYKKPIPMNKNNPAYLYGYGGFNISMTPYFSVSNLQWMEMGGIFTMPNLRGGGEYGLDWYKQGILDKKQNVFDDFIAAAEYLIQKGYTSPAKLAIGGASNGGLLVAACMAQRPKLFGAALPDVGVLDMLRYHEFTIGWAWSSDYGRSDNPDQFSYLYAYSPLHNLKVGEEYPATLITTADHDDRVVPAHSFKFAATLQKAQGGDAPVLIRIETRAGHGGGMPTQKRIELQADMWAFLVKNLRMAY